ncbi:MAG: hypothetical protein ACXIVQ_15480 [Acidimicrobiales bacterium]
MPSEEQPPIVVRREIHRGRIWSAHPSLVLADDDAELVTVRIPRSMSRVPASKGDLSGVRGDFEHGEWRLVERASSPYVGVGRTRPGRHYNVIHVFEPATGEFLCWYVQFERPVSRHPDGLVVDTLGLWLGLIVLPDGSHFWKDTDTWQWAGATGLLQADEVARVEQLRDELVADATARRGVFDGAWCEWAPIELDPLDLPSYWDRAPLVVDARETCEHH